MAGSTRFAASVHVLAVLAAYRPRPVTSEFLAQSVNTNPAVVRRLISALIRAGLATTQLGKGGGAMLARGPKKITLLDIYRAVETPGFIPMQRAAPNPQCPVGGAIVPVLQYHASAAETALEGALAGVTLKQVIREIAAQNAAAKSAA